MAGTKGSGTISTKQDEIAKLARREPQLVLTTLAHRVDRLRLGGNGVHPLAAAYAFHALRARFGDRR